MKWIDVFVEFQNNMAKLFQDKLANTHFLLTVSGGIDSMVLLELFYKAKLNFKVAHCNFGLREEDSDFDEELVIQTCIEKGIPYFTKKISIKSAEIPGKSVQLEARDKRYTWFNELLVENKLDYIVTAHHANDNLETILFNFIRGCGIQGLQGIPQKTGNILRPLLEIEKTDIIAFANKNQVTSRLDTSNLSTKYKRNKIRLEIIPKLEEINPQVCRTVQEHLPLFHDLEEMLEVQTKFFVKNQCRQQEDCFIISLGEIFKTAGKLNILNRILQEFGFSMKQCQFLLENKLQHSGTKIISNTHELYLHGNNWIVAPPIFSFVPIIIENIPCQVNTAFGNLTFENEVDLDLNSIENNNQLLVLDVKIYEPNLVVRTRQDGDWFRPAGMKGQKQKLKNYFINEKMSIPEKERQLLLCSGSEVLWVIGKRKSLKVLYTTHSNNFIKITFTKAK